MNLNEIRKRAEEYRDRLTNEVITPYSDLSWAADTILQLCDEVERLRGELPMYHWPQYKLKKYYYDKIEQLKEQEETHKELNRQLANRNDDLKSELAEKDSVLEFYSKSYENDGAFYGTLFKDKVVGGDMETINSFAIAGKRAREVMAKYKKSEG